MKHIRLPVVLAVFAIMAACAAPQPSIVGTWQSPNRKYDDNVSPLSYTFAQNGTGSVAYWNSCLYSACTVRTRTKPISWSVDGDKITILEGSQGEALTYKIQGATLQLSFTGTPFLGGAPDTVVYVFNRIK